MRQEQAAAVIGPAPCQNENAPVARFMPFTGGQRPHPHPHHCMNQPWLTTTDWPVSAALGKADRNSTVCATS